MIVLVSHFRTVRSKFYNAEKLCVFDSTTDCRALVNVGALGSHQARCQNEEYQFACYENYYWTNSNYHMRCEPCPIHETTLNKFCSGLVPGVNEPWWDWDDIVRNAACCRDCMPCQFEFNFITNNGAGKGCSRCPDYTWNRVPPSTVAPTGVQTQCYECPQGYKGSANPDLGCEICPAGKYKDTTGSSDCVLCPAGKINQDEAQTSSSSCNNCESNQEANAQRTQCVSCPAGKFSEPGDSCTECEDTTAGEPTYRTPTMLVCQRCGRKVFVNEDGLNVDCLPCDEWKYSFSGFKCEEISRRRLDFIQGKLANIYVKPTKDVFKNARLDNSVVEVPEGFYIDLTKDVNEKAGHILHECFALSCLSGYYRSHCGSYADHFNVWLSAPSNFQNAEITQDVEFIKVMQRMNRTTFLLQDFRNALLQSSFIYPDKVMQFIQQNISVIPEGQCQQCKQCIEGHYLLGCNDFVSWHTHLPPGSGTCLDCTPSGGCPATDYLSHDFAGRCTPSADYIPEQPFTCAACPVSDSNDNEVYLVVGCGTQATLERWHPRAEVDDDGSLLTVTCTYSEQHDECDHAAEYDECENCFYDGVRLSSSGGLRNSSVMPYCPPGWYVNQTCYEENSDEASRYAPQCCKRCTTCGHGERAVRDCNGTSFQDVSCTDSCAPGEFKQMLPNSDIFICQPCGIKCV